MPDDTKDPNRKQPGEKPAGKYHYNPGNMSGKEAENADEDAARENNADRKESREPPPKHRQE